jgi:hypothetical protein
MARMVVIFQIIRIFFCPTDSFQLARSSSWCEGQQSATVYFV